MHASSPLRLPAPLLLLGCGALGLAGCRSDYSGKSDRLGVDLELQVLSPSYGEFEGKQVRFLEHISPGGEVRLIGILEARARLNALTNRVSYAASPVESTRAVFCDIGWTRLADFY